MNCCFYKKLIRALLCAVLCVGLTLSALAADAPGDGKTRRPAFTLGVTAFPQSAHTTVNLWWDGTEGVLRLFLPSQCDLSASKISLTGAVSVAVDGVTLADGSAADIFSAGDHTLVCGGQSYRLQVLQSANLPAVFLETASGSQRRGQHQQRGAEIRQRAG